MSAGFSALSRALLAFACTIPERRFNTLLIVGPFFFVLSCEQAVKGRPRLLALPGLLGEGLREAVDPLRKRYLLRGHDYPTHGPAHFAIDRATFAVRLEDDPGTRCEVDCYAYGGLVALEEPSPTLYGDPFAECIGEL